MKILAVHNVIEGSKKVSAVDIWRIWRPIRELRKHVNWQIDEQNTFIKDIAKYKDQSEFTEEELERAAEQLGQYDIIWSSYFSNPSFYALLRAVNARYGTKFVLDVDDDMFGIKEDNPIWLKLSDENVYHMQCMIRDADYITTTTETLAKVLRERRKKPHSSVFVVPNYISEDYKHGPIDNGETVEIGYFGGSSHYNDLHDSGALEAIERIMHKHKNVRFTTVGMIVDKYIPRGRYTYNPGSQGMGWITDVFPKLNFDISIAPIDSSRFSRCKSDIKWQESTMMGAAFVASKHGPYARLKNGANALLVQNNVDAWHTAIEKLVIDAIYRKQLVSNAQRDLKGRILETHTDTHRAMFEAVYSHDKSRDLELLGV